MLEFNDYVYGFLPAGPTWKLTESFTNGQTWQFLGSNGSGKTTLGKAVVGLFPAVGGIGSYAGRDLARLEASFKRRHFLFVPQQPQWSFLGSTFIDHIHVFGRILDQRLDEAALGLLRGWPEVQELLTRKFDDCNSEQLAILAILEDLVFPKNILVFDEFPDLEVDAHQEIFLHILRHRASEGRLSIFTRHQPFPSQSGHSFKTLTVSSLVNL